MKQADAKGSFKVGRPPGIPIAATGNIALDHHVLDHQRELALDHLALAVLGLTRCDQHHEEVELRLAAAKRLLSRLKAKE